MGQQPRAWRPAGFVRAVRGCPCRSALSPAGGGGPHAPEGLAIYWDTSGHHDFDSAIGLLARGGRIILSAGKPELRPELPVSSAYRHDVSLVGFAISNATVHDLAAAAKVINQRVADRTLGARIADTLPLSEAAEAHRRVEEGEVSGGRLILRP